VKLLRSLTSMQIALGVSVVVHAALLTVRFVDPASRRTELLFDESMEVFHKAADILKISPRKIQYKLHEYGRVGNATAGAGAISTDDE